MRSESSKDALMAQPRVVATGTNCRRLISRGSWISVFGVLLALFQFSSASAQTPSGNLTALVDSGAYAYNGLEIAAAATNDAAYSALLPVCATPGAGTCTGNVLNLFNRLRELEDTANGLLGRGETTYSLRLNYDGVASALRWTAPEEYAAQGSLTNRFANDQMLTLGGRFAALRLATQVARLQRGDDAYPWVSESPRLASYLSGTPASGGGASADGGTFAAANWNAFGNGSYSAGSKSPTTFEDAFNYNDTEYSAGGDLRLNSRVVVGLLAGRTIKNVNFNSSESVVSGGIRGRGYSGIVYGQYEGDAAYANASLGVQHLDLETRRAITYPSLNPLIPSVNETSFSATTATSFIANVGGGYSFHWRGFSAEPFANAQYVHTKIDPFTEHSGNGFDTDVDSQAIESVTSSIGLKIQQAFLPPFGVIIPYVSAEYRHEFSQDSRTVHSQYAAAGTPEGGAADFSLPTDQPGRNYYVVGGGLTMVFKHGVQGFLQYVKVLQLTNYTDYVASGGIRFEF